VPPPPRLRALPIAPIVAQDGIPPLISSLFSSLRRLKKVDLVCPCARGEQAGLAVDGGRAPLPLLKSLDDFDPAAPFFAWTYAFLFSLLRPSGVESDSDQRF